MALHEAVSKGDELIIHSPVTGYLTAHAMEDMGEFAMLAHFQVSVNAEALPGVSRMTINVNTWDVWKGDNIDALRKVARTVLKPEYVR